MKENSNGRTPLDIATDMYLHDVVRNPLPPIIPEEEETRAAAAVYEMLLKKVQSTPAKRKRATLFEANELAKRYTLMFGYSKFSANICYYRLANANKNVEPYQHRHSQHDADDKMLPSLGWVWDG